LLKKSKKTVHLNFFKNNNKMQFCRIFEISIFLPNRFQGKNDFNLKEEIWKVNFRKHLCFDEQIFKETLN